MADHREDPVFHERLKQQQATILSLIQGETVRYAENVPVQTTRRYTDILREHSTRMDAWFATARRGKTAGHCVICKGCLRRRIAAAEREGRTEITCPLPACTASHPIGPLRAALQTDRRWAPYSQRPPTATQVEDVQKRLNIGQRLPELSVPASSIPMPPQTTGTQRQLLEPLPTPTISRRLPRLPKPEAAAPPSLPTRVPLGPIGTTVPTPTMRRSIPLSQVMFTPEQIKRYLPEAIKATTGENPAEFPVLDPSGKYITGPAANLFRTGDFGQTLEILYGRADTPTIPDAEQNIQILCDALRYVRRGTSDNNIPWLIHPPTESVKRCAQAIAYAHMFYHTGPHKTDPIPPESINYVSTGVLNFLITHQHDAKLHSVLWILLGQVLSMFVIALWMA